jgi:hypothetical protein
MFRRTGHHRDPAAEGELAARRRQRHSHTLRPRGVPSASHQASHRHSGTSDSKQSAWQGSTVPSGHSSGGHAHEGECWARSTGPSGCAHPLSGTGSHRARGTDHAASATLWDVALRRSGHSASTRMVTIMRRRTVCVLRVRPARCAGTPRGQMRTWSPPSSPKVILLAKSQIRAVSKVRKSRMA